MDGDLKILKREGGSRVKHWLNSGGGKLFDYNIALS